MNLKKIGGLAFILAIIGFCIELIKLLPFHIDYALSPFPAVLENCLSPLQLNFFHARVFEYYNEANNTVINYLNLFVYAIALIGAVLFDVSKQKEMRLLRFFFALIVLQHILGLFTNFLVTVVHFAAFSSTWFHFSMYVCFNFLWVYISYTALKELNKTQVLETLDTAEGSEGNKLAAAGKGLRLFHYIIDNIFCLMLLSQFTKLVNELGLGKIHFVTGPIPSLFILLLVFSLIYFPFYETLFGASPAKFLTGTRVTKRDGSCIDFKTSLIRTLCRSIPFEQISFFGDKGWHDGISDTRVVQEKQK